MNIYKTTHVEDLAELIISQREQIIRENLELAKLYEEWLQEFSEAYSKDENEIDYEAALKVTRTLHKTISDINNSAFYESKSLVVERHDLRNIQAVRDLGELVDTEDEVTFLLLGVKPFPDSVDVLETGMGRNTGRSNRNKYHWVTRVKPMVDEGVGGGVLDNTKKETALVLRSQSGCLRDEYGNPVQQPDSESIETNLDGGVSEHKTSSLVGNEIEHSESTREETRPHPLHPLRKAGGVMDYRNPVSQEQAWEWVRDLATHLQQLADDNDAIVSRSKTSRYPEFCECCHQSVSPKDSKCFARTQARHEARGQSVDSQARKSDYCAKSGMLAHSDTRYQAYSSSLMDCEIGQSQSIGEESKPFGGDCHE